MARVPAILIKINGFFRSQNTPPPPPDLALFPDKVLFLRLDRPVQSQILPDHRPACHRPIQFQKCDAQSRRSFLDLSQNTGRRFGRLGRIAAVNFHRHSIATTFKVHTIGVFTHEQTGFNVFVRRFRPKPFQMRLSNGGQRGLLRLSRHNTVIHRLAWRTSHLSFCRGQCAQRKTALWKCLQKAQRAVL